MRLQDENEAANRTNNKYNKGKCVYVFFFSTRKFNILCYKIENGERWPDPD